MIPALCLALKTWPGYWLQLAAHVCDGMSLFSHCLGGNLWPSYWLCSAIFTLTFRPPKEVCDVCYWKRWTFFTRNWVHCCIYTWRGFSCALLSNNVLAHYSPEMPVKLAANGSSYGVGAVSSHQYADGSKRPIAFASRSLSGREKNYFQLEKEQKFTFLDLANFICYQTLPTWKFRQHACASSCARQFFLSLFL